MEQWNAGEHLFECVNFKNNYFSVYLVSRYEKCRTCGMSTLKMYKQRYRENVSLSNILIVTLYLPVEFFMQYIDSRQ